MSNDQVEQQLRGDLSAFTRRADLVSLGVKVENYIEWTKAEQKRLKTIREKIQVDLEAQIGARLPDKHALIQIAAATILTAEEEARDLHKRLVAVLHDVQEKLASLSSNEPV